MKGCGNCWGCDKSRANMFGYGAFDSNPENANNFNDEVAVVALTQQTIIGNKSNLQNQDDKVKKLTSGTLNTAVDGGLLYRHFWFRKRRRETMQSWILTLMKTEEPKHLNRATVKQETVARCYFKRYS